VNFEDELNVGMHVWAADFPDKFAGGEWRGKAVVFSPISDLEKRVALRQGLWA
jgi:hypothetical protein